MAISQWLAIISLVISGLAFFRPEIQKGFTKLFGDIEIFPPDGIEVGYSGFGPVIGINTVLRSQYGTIFIRDISLSVTRLGDPSVHRFSWRAFRKLNYIDRQKSEVEPAAAFSLGDSATRTLNILFSDAEVVARLDPLAKRLQMNLIAQAKAKWGSHLDLNSQAFEEFAGKFRDSKPAEAEAFATGLASEFYWREGSYGLVVEFSMDQGRKPVRRTYKFQLTLDDEQSLTGNYPLIVDEITGKKTVIYYEARPRLMS